MHIRTSRLATAAAALTLSVSMTAAVAAAQDGDRNEKSSASHTRGCTNATAAGTFGYRMNGVFGVDPFLVNGLFTHHPDGTMDADVELVIGNASIPLLGTDGTFTTNRDCTGSGRFATQSPLGDVKYNFVLTDDGNQIELLNTNPGIGIVLQGVGRRISKAGAVARCRADMIVGAYGYRLEGSLPGLQNVAVAGLIRQALDHHDRNTGTITGSDTMSLMGQIVPRSLRGTFTLGGNCRGSGSYVDSIGNHVSFVFTVVNDGDTMFLQGSAPPGAAIFGVAQRVQSDDAKSEYHRGR